ncbi:MAG TPA: sugar phosphate isomerase/epimerase family protein [Phycisphaerae bacterium]|nr:sugar phosphate isomerase/epimerase family protein [Phycisphaerae bacterium]
MKLATCNEPWRETPVEEVFPIAAELGFDGVEIAPFTIAENAADIPPDRRRRIVKAAADAGVEIVGLHWLFISPKGLHLTTPDAAVRRQAADYLKHLADFCGDLGGKVMIFGSPKQRHIEPPTTYADAWARAGEVFSAAADTLAARGVTLCIEALAPAETNFIQTLDESTKLADEIGHPNIDVMIDCKAMSSMPDGVVGTIRRFGKRAKHFHANEAGGKGVGMPIGPGEPPAIDFAAVMKALVETGYDRWVSVEPFDYKPDPTTVARTAIETLKSALASAKA